MLTYTLDNNRETLTSQLYNHIRTDILNHTLQAHDKLPSKRAFAKHLNISTITVENTYLQLLSEGLIYAKPRIGYFISELPLTPAPVTPHNHFTLEGIEKPAYFCDFSSNHTRPEDFPFSIWAKLSRETLSLYQDELMMPSPSGGTARLRQAIARHLRSFRNIDVTPDQIIIGAGTEYLYGLLIQLIGFEMTYGVETPGYQKISAIYDAYHVKKINLPIDDQGLKVDGKRLAEVDILHITPSHHFPTGITMPVSRRYALLNWAQESPNRYIIEDDYDSEFRLMGKPIPSMQSIDHHEKVIYINTFTKSLSSTIRVSYMVLPPHLAKRFYEQLSFSTCTVSTFEQYTLALFIERGYFEKHINRMRNTFRHKRNHVLEAIRQSPLSDIASIREDNAGLHFLIHLDLHCSDEELISRALDRGIHLTSLRTYGLDEPHTFLINYSSLPEDRLEEAVNRLYQSTLENS